MKREPRSNKVQANVVVERDQRSVDSDWLSLYQETKSVLAKCNQCRMRVEVCIIDEALVTELHLLKCLRGYGVLERCEKSMAKSTNY